MKRSSIEASFESFRTQGDVIALEFVFDETAPELMRVAAHLAPEPAAVEDLLQATWVAALEAAASWDAKRPLMPWLVGILTRKAAKARRNAARVPDPTRLHEPGAADPSTRVEEREFFGKLKQALRGLPPGYREVLEAQLLQGKPPVEIAGEFSRAPGTVRMQIHRGLDLLRKALPPGLATGGALAVSATRGEAAVKAIVLRRATDFAPTLVGASIAATPLILGGVLRSTKAGLGAVALALLALVTYVSLDPQADVDLADAGRVPQHSVLPAVDLPSVNTDPGTERSSGGTSTEVSSLIDSSPQSLVVSSTKDTTAWRLTGRLSGVASEDYLAVSVMARGELTSFDTVRGTLDTEAFYSLDITRFVWGSEPARGDVVPLLRPSLVPQYKRRGLHRRSAS
ncbi:MAG: RNA polymerase sigma factor (sigma-70 family) [Planctomycetota bacterium]|jgi:RNA polymerase sigma factor (sigma-70 family)